MYMELKSGKSEEKMRKLTGLVLSVFRYLASYETFNAADFFASLGADGAILERRYRGRLDGGAAGDSRLKKLLDELNKEPLSERVSLYEAMAKDVDYTAHIEDEAFQFAESTLQKEILNKAVALTTYLYDEIFVRPGFQVEGETVNRKLFKKDFYHTNFSASEREVCPVCLQWSARQKESSQLDHFFPKAKYPALVFQPENLAVVCMECNVSGVKGQKDPMEETNLTELFLPYQRAAEKEARIRIFLDEEGRHLELVPLGGDAKIQKRIDNFDRLYGVTECWNKQADRYVEECFHIIRGCDSLEKAEGKLAMYAEDKRNIAAIDKSHLIESCCYDYMETEGYRIFQEECEKRLEEQRKMQNG